MLQSGKDLYLVLGRLEVIVFDFLGVFPIVYLFEAIPFQTIDGCIFRGLPFLNIRIVSVHRFAVQRSFWAQI